jgi:RNA polymerase sigma factor FliA
MDAADPMWQAYKRNRGGQERDALIMRHLPLAHYVVERLHVRGTTSVGYEDLVSCAILGLIDAVDRYDPDRGVRFESYALPRIRGTVVDMMRSMDWAPRSVRRKQDAWRKACVRVESRWGRPGTDLEVAQEMGVELHELERGLMEIGQAAIVSLETALGPDGAASSPFALGDALAADDNPAREVEDRDLKERLRDAIEHLPERDQVILSLYYADGLTLREIGLALGVTEARVCQLHGRAVSRLRAVLGDEPPVPVPPRPARRRRAPAALAAAGRPSA